MNKHAVLHGSMISPISGSRLKGTINPNEIASVIVRIRSSGDPKELVKEAYSLANTPLSKRQYLTHEELARKYGATESDIDKVEHYSKKHNLTVVRRSAAERCIVLKGQLGDLLAAFPADVQIYHHAACIYRGRRGEIHVPHDLRSIITGIFGFDTRPRSRSPHRMKSAAFNNDSIGNNGEIATYFASRYNFPNQHGDMLLDGTGQTIAIIELGGGYQSSDLQVFFQKIGIPMPNVSWVPVDSISNTPTTSDSADGEVMLDIEVASAVIPGADIVVYFAPNEGDQGFIDAVSAAIHDTQRNPSVISISWGSPESNNDAQSITAFHELFAAAAVLGITICVSSGDHGAADLAASIWDQKVHVNFPASDDLVLACGGTQIDAVSDQDVVWNDGTPFDVKQPDGGGWASGGGISEVFGVPSYQSHLTLPKSISHGKKGRGIPDIAMSARDYFTRVDSFESVRNGTSAVAPLMAALVARLNQAKQKNVGFLNPFLYANAARGVVHEVTVGTNAITNTLQGYNAGPDWNACCGLGTPDGVAILDSLS